MRMPLVLGMVACAGDDTSDGVTPDGNDTDVVDTDRPVDTDTEPTPGDIGANGVLTMSPEMGTLVSASWDQVVRSDETWLSWEVDNVTYTTPVVPREVGPATQVLLGAASDTTLDVVLHAIVEGEEQIWYVDSIKTDFLPFDLTDPMVVTNDPLLRRPERYLLASIEVGPNWFWGPVYTVVLDSHTGRIVWYRKTPGSRLTWQAQVSERGGYILVDQSTYYSGGAP
jgi:hypothetical protein